MQVTMSAEGEIRIPKEMREVLALDAGAELELSVWGERLVISKASRERGGWRKLQGLLAGDGPDLLKELEAEHAEEIARDERRLQDL